MTDRFNIEIAGVHVQVNSFSLNLSEDLELSYRSFLSPWKSSVVSDISVNVIAMSDQNMRGIPKIFDSGQSWSMHKQDGTYYIVYNKPSPDRPFWIAESNQDFSKITLYCNTNIAGYGQDSKIIVNPVRYPLDQIILMYYLARRGGILIHASGIEINQKGYIFAGRSGAGKTTIATQFLERHHAELLSDDRIVVRKINNMFRAFGTPWPGEAGIAVNRAVNLSGMFFISHASSNKIEEIKPQKALEKLFPVTSIPWYDKEIMVKILDFCGDLISHIPVYELYFKPDDEVVDVFEKFISKQ